MKRQPTRAFSGVCSAFTEGAETLAETPSAAVFQQSPDRDLTPAGHSTGLFSACMLSCRRIIPARFYHMLIWLYF